jgi:hypothetical protein
MRPTPPISFTVFAPFPRLPLSSVSSPSTSADSRIQQTSCQVVHYPHHSQVITEPAPEPRDVVWKHVAMSPREFTIRNFVVMGVMILLLLTWIGESTPSDSYDDFTISVFHTISYHAPHQVISARTPSPPRQSVSNFPCLMTHTKSSGVRPGADES